MTFTISKQFKFEAAHKLPLHDGKCARLHGHSYVLTIFVQGEVVNSGSKSGMVQDFGDLNMHVKPLLESYLDHHYLNDTTALDNPTSEEISRWVFNKLKPSLQQLIAVKISETCTTECLYPSLYQLLS